MKEKDGYHVTILGDSVDGSYTPHIMQRPFWENGKVKGFV